jgi:regulator of protease activity HflC (stomatin/prohibitin superfamily)
VNLLVVFILAAIILLLMVGSSARMVQQYEQGIVFRFGRLLPGNRGPGLTFIVPFVDGW